MTGEKEGLTTKGIVGGIAIRVKLVSFRRGDEKQIGKIGLLEPIELSVNGDIIVGLFYPDGPLDGFGRVLWPQFESVQ